MIFSSIISSIIHSQTFKKCDVHYNIFGKLCNSVALSSIRNAKKRTKFKGILNATVGRRALNLAHPKHSRCFNLLLRTTPGRAAVILLSTYLHYPASEQRNETCARLSNGDAPEAVRVNRIC